jgi:hypothetical protein
MSRIKQASYKHTTVIYSQARKITGLELMHINEYTLIGQV